MRQYKPLPALLAFVAIGILGGCREQPTGPAAPLLPDRPASAILDGAHGGNTRFFFLPPTVPSPEYTGTFDGTQSPTVRVCELAGVACGATVATFSGAQVKVDLRAEAYVAVWKTKGAGLDPAKTYRILVALGTEVLGFADVVVVANGSQFKTVDQSQFIATINGSALPIRFRIETAAAPPPPPPPCTSGCEWSDGDIITYSASSWGESSLPGGPQIVAHYDAVYAATFGETEVGIPGAAGHSMIFSSSGAVLAYLPSTGPAAALNADLLDPLSSASGIFGGEVLGLRFNIDFADAGFTLGTSGLRFGDLTLCNLGGTLAALNGSSLRAFSSIINTALGGGSTPYLIQDLSILTFAINNAFSDGVVTAFAQQHLFDGGCPATSGWQNGDVISYTQVSWGDGLAIGGAQLNANFDNVYTFGYVEVGILGSASYYSLIFTNSGAVLDYLPASGPASALNADLIDPTSTASGIFGGEVLGLRFNMDFSAAGYTSGALGIPFGYLTLCGLTGSLAGLNGLSIGDFAVIVNTALGGGPTAYAIADLNALALDINGSFLDGVPSAFAQQHLFIFGACR